MTAKQIIPAAFAAFMPLIASSATIQAAGGRLRRFAAVRKISGSGFRFTTSDPEMMLSSASRGIREAVILTLSFRLLALDAMAVLYPMARIRRTASVAPSNGIM